jgi:uncharacterized protein YbjT (DUF2867 family)
MQADEGVVGVGHGVIIPQRGGGAASVRFARVKFSAFVVRATQFFEFLGGIAGSGADGGAVLLPEAPMQPLAADDVAAALADAAVGPPANATLELAGPEAQSIAAFVRRALAASGDRRAVVADPQARYFGAAPDRSASGTPQRAFPTIALALYQRCQRGPMRPGASGSVIGT